MSIDGYIYRIKCFKGMLFSVISINSSQKFSFFLIITLLSFPSSLKAENIKEDPDGWKIKGALAALEDPNKEIQAKALYELAALKSPSTVPKIAEKLKEEDNLIISAAIHTLGSMGELAREHIPKISSFLSHLNPEVRFAAINALSNLGELALEHAPQISGLLRNQDPDIRTAALRALSAMGKAAHQEAPKIELLLVDPVPDVQAMAASALGSIGKMPKKRMREIINLELLSNLVYEEILKRRSALIE